jgi:hypothetical protein
MAIWARLDKLEGALLVPGTFLLVPFRAENLGFGVYYANGDRYSLDEPQGQVIYGLSEDYKTDWGLTVSNNTINLPNLFAPDGRGYFPRVGSVPGVEQGDAMRTFAGFVGGVQFIRTAYDPSFLPTGPFSVENKYANIGLSTTNYTGMNLGETYFDPSTVVPTADENRPINKTLVPGVWLGV